MALVAGINVVGKVPGTLVCTLTLTISIGHKARQAQNSDPAAPVSQINSRYF
jgi:hypothetical protein